MALKALRLVDTGWGVNAQPYLGIPAIFSAYSALLNPLDRVPVLLGHGDLISHMGIIPPVVRRY